MRAAICFMEIGDVRYDGRSYNMATSLSRAGHAVRFIVTGDKNSRVELEQIDLVQLGVRRWFWSKLYFLHYYLKLIPAAFSARADLYVSADLFSLPIAYLVARVRGARVVYDAKEFYFATAALKDRPHTQRFWAWVEGLFVKRVDGITVAGEDDSRIVAQRYGVPPPTPILNHPPYVAKVERSQKLRQELSIPPEKKIILYQGGLQSGRGLFLSLDVLVHLPDSVLVFLGEGHLKGELSRTISAQGLEGRAFIRERVEYPNLIEYTASADIGLALVEDYGLSYRYARPNKLFEYVMAGVPVVVTNFPVMREVVERYDVGVAVDLAEPAVIARVIDAILKDANRYRRLVENCRSAAKVLCWEKEEPKFLALIQSVLKPGMEPQPLQG